MKKVLIPVLVLIFAAAAGAQQAAVTAHTQDAAKISHATLEHVSDGAGPEQKDVPHISTKSGGALLDAYMDSLMAMTGKGTSEALELRLQEMMLAAKKAREGDEIDAVFFYRFNRLLAVTKLVAAPDPAGILVPVIVDFISNFVLEKLGHDEFRLNGKGPNAIGHVAAAMSAELIDLQIYLMTFKERAGLEQKIGAAISGGPKK